MRQMSDEHAAALLQRQAEAEEQETARTSAARPTALLRRLAWHGGTMGGRH
jgi:hypothetical protein